MLLKSGSIGAGDTSWRRGRPDSVAVDGVRTGERPNATAAGVMPDYCFGSWRAAATLSDSPSGTGLKAVTSLPSGSSKIRTFPS